MLRGDRHHPVDPGVVVQGGQIGLDRRVQHAVEDLGAVRRPSPPRRPIARGRPDLESSRRLDERRHVVAVEDAGHHDIARPSPGSGWRRPPRRDRSTTRTGTGATGRAADHADHAGRRSRDRRSGVRGRAPVGPVPSGRIEAPCPSKRSPGRRRRGRARCRGRMPGRRSRRSRGRRPCRRAHRLRRSRRCHPWGRRCTRRPGIEGPAFRARPGRRTRAPRCRTRSAREGRHGGTGGNRPHRPRSPISDLWWSWSPDLSFPRLMLDRLQLDVARSRLRFAHDGASCVDDPLELVRRSGQRAAVEHLDGGIDAESSP